MNYINFAFFVLLITFYLLSWCIVDVPASTFFICCFSLTAASKAHYKLGGLKQQRNLFTHSSIWNQGIARAVTREDPYLLQLLVAPGIPYFSRQLSISLCLTVLIFPVCLCIQISFFSVGHLSSWIAPVMTSSPVNYIHKDHISQKFTVKFWRVGLHHIPLGGHNSALNICVITLYLVVLEVVLGFISRYVAYQSTFNVTVPYPWSV